MFTGLVEAAAAVRAIGRRAGGARLDVERPEAFVDAARGESISVSGVCLTIVPGAESGLLRFDVSAETLDRSTLGALRPGDAVNLERALAAGGRMGGHVVQGHVDATTPRRSSRGAATSGRSESGSTPRSHGTWSRRARSRSTGSR